MCLCDAGFMVRKGISGSSLALQERDFRGPKPLEVAVPGSPGRIRLPDPRSVSGKGVFFLHSEELAAIHPPSALKLGQVDQAHPAGEPPWRPRESGRASLAFSFLNAMDTPLPLYMVDLESWSRGTGKPILGPGVAYC